MFNLIMSKMSILTSLPTDIGVCLKLGFRMDLNGIMCTHMKPQCVSSRVKAANWSFESRFRNSSPKLKRIAWLSHLPIHKFSLLRASLRRRTGMQLNISISN